MKKKIHRKMPPYSHCGKEYVALSLRNCPSQELTLPSICCCFCFVLFFFCYEIGQSWFEKTYSPVSTYPLSHGSRSDRENTSRQVWELCWEPGAERIPQDEWIFQRKHLRYHSVRSVPRSSVKSNSLFTSAAVSAFLNIWVKHSAWNLLKDYTF